MYQYIKGGITFVSIVLQIPNFYDISRISTLSKQYLFFLSSKKKKKKKEEQRKSRKNRKTNK